MSNRVNSVCEEVYLKQPPGSKLQQLQQIRNEANIITHFKFILSVFVTNKHS